MAAKRERVLAVAVRDRQMACVLVDNGKLIDRQGTKVGARCPDLAVAMLRGWVATYDPTLVVTENPDDAGKKGDRIRDILGALAAAADDLPVKNVVLIRKRTHGDLYQQAKDLGAMFPDVEVMVPTKPKCWQREAYRLALFEALALAMQATDTPIVP
jgi:hypothetical protein